MSTTATQEVPVSSTEEIVSVRTGKKPLFEAQTCSRCGGSGQYSWNAMHGSRCFGCGGHGYKLTKRGAAAQELYRELLSKKVEDLQVGDKIVNQGVPGIAAGGWVVVTSVETIDYTFRRGDEQVTEKRVKVICDSVREGGLGLGLTDYPGTVHRVAADADAKRAAREQALAFQATLTKQGQPRKVQS